MEYLKYTVLDSPVFEFINSHRYATLFGSAAALYAIYFLKRPRNLPPGPWGYPYIGSWLELTGNVTEDLKRLGDKYGDPCCVWMGADKYVIIMNSLDVIKEANVKSGVDFAQREPTYCFGGFDAEEPLFNGALNDDHKLCRRVSVTSFRKFITEKLSSVLDDEISKLNRVIDQSLGKPLFISTPIERVLSNVFCAVHFNETYELDDPELHEFVDGVEKWYIAFEDAYKNALVGKTVFVSRPHSAMKLLSDYNKFIKKRIEDHAKTIDKQHPRDVIDIFIKEGALQKLGADLLANQIGELVPNGVYTASIVLNWMFSYLFQYPEYHKAIVKEMQDLKGSSPVVLEDRPNLPLTEAFMLEVLRLKTPLQISLMTTTTYPTKLMGYDIPTRSTIVANYVAVHEDPKLFPDPLMFKPERFIDENGKIHIGEGFLVFGIGRRICVGEALIKNMMFFIFASIVQRYNILEDRSTVIKKNVHNNFVFKMENFHVILEKKE